MISGNVLRYWNGFVIRRGCETCLAGSRVFYLTIPNVGIAALGLSTLLEHVREGQREFWIVERAVRGKIAELYRQFAHFLSDVSVD